MAAELLAASAARASWALTGPRHDPCLASMSERVTNTVPPLLP